MKEKDIRIHVVDDLEIQYSGHESLFKRYENLQLVKYSLNGIEAIHYEKHTKSDVIILDLCVEDRNGMEVLKYLQKHRIGGNVIVYSSFATKDIIADALRFGAKGYVLKGDDIELIIEAIYKVADNLEYTSNAVKNILGQKPCSFTPDAFKYNVDIFDKQELQDLSIVCNDAPNSSIEKESNIPKNICPNILARIRRKINIQTKIQWIKKHIAES